MSIRHIESQSDGSCRKSHGTIRYPADSLMKLYDNPCPRLRAADTLFQGYCNDIPSFWPVQLTSISRIRLEEPNASQNLESELDPSRPNVNWRMNQRPPSHSMVIRI
ncbi:hypothetical protein CIHG_09381 [Coccidioides immitis H538.4]|uniref:Uncharacterized protein n=2 Tax=Coccidioides immitis TaxID=5501 RepID=A0A0J8S421_COCIT|nr:hypothetical protein CIRG_02542 [Coccidioides immitis RMSCC 2394]KMU91571.1 hypothetical protein CIHG_09381 [Coccidioides immitis H538.4]